MNFANSTQIAIDISICLEQLSSFIESRSKKVAKNSRGIVITQEDLEELKGIYEKMTNVCTMVAKNEALLTQHVSQNTYMKGKIEHMNNVLQLCYNDYKNNNRQDAITFLTIELNK